MANIKNHLNNIKNALFGQEVRGSIHDGIDAINKEVESTTDRQVDLENTFDQLVINAGNSNAEIVDARVKSDGTSYSKLGDRLDSVDSQLEHIENNVRKFLKPEDMPSYNEANAYQAITDIINSGNNVLFELDSYNLEGVIKVASNTTITSNNNSLINYAQTSNTYFLLEGSSILLEKFKINANKCKNGVYTNNAINCEIKSLNISDLMNFAIAITNSDGVYVSDNTIDSKDSKEGCIACVLSNNVHVNNNNVRNGGHYGVIFEDQVYNSTITNNVIEEIKGCGIGVVNIQPKDDLLMTNVVVSNNVIKSVWYDGVLVLDSPNVSVFSNNIQQLDKQSPSVNLSNGIRFGMKCGNFEACNNTIVGFKATGINCSTNDNGNGVVKDNLIAECATDVTYGKNAIKCSNINNLYYCGNKVIGKYDKVTFSNITNLVAEKTKYTMTFDVSDTQRHRQLIPKNSKITKILFKVKNVAGGSYTQVIFNNSGSQIINLHKIASTNDVEYEYFIKEENDFPAGLKRSYNINDEISLSVGNSANTVGTPHAVVTIEFEY